MPIEVSGDEQKSKIQLLKEINTADPSSEEYWTDGSGSLGIIPRALVFLDSFFAINYTISRISDKIDKMNLQLSSLITQNAFLNKTVSGLLLQASMTRGELKEGLSEMSEQISDIDLSDVGGDELPDDEEIPGDFE